MKILIADDHALIRDTIAVFLRIEGIEEVVTTSSFDEALAATQDTDPFDLIILDYDMPGMNGLEGLATLKTAYPNVPVAILSGSANLATLAEKAIAGGAAGFLPKTINAKSLAHAVRFMASGEIFVPFNLINSTEKGIGSGIVLNERESQVLAGIGEGLSNKEIGRLLNLHEVTVKMHVKHLMRKFDARNRAHVVTLARKLSFI